MKTGVITILDNDIESKIEKIHNMGFEYCQINCWNMKFYTDEMAKRILDALEKYSVKVSTFWAGWSGRAKWNFTEGPLTLGIVPEAFRYARIIDLKNGSDFAKKIGVDQIATHVGFIPEDPNSERYRGVVSAIRDIAGHAAVHGQKFLFETGQETPVTLLRTIEDVQLDNLGINLDPANLIMYGKANPVDALDIIGKYVCDVHAKDGCYPTNGSNLGKETAVGEGRVNFPALIAKLKEVGYDGTLTIEREIKGEKQIEDIHKAKNLLESLI